MEWDELWLLLCEQETKQRLSHNDSNYKLAAMVMGTTGLSVIRLWSIGQSPLVTAVAVVATKLTMTSLLTTDKN